MSYTIGGLIISGSIAKTLHVKVSGVNNNYEHTYTDSSIGTRTYPSTAPLQWKPNGGWDSGMFGSSYGTGLYKMEIWLTSGTVSSAVLTYYIMCIKDSNVSTAKLVCVNEFPNEVSNYVTNTMFGFAVYNGTSETSDTVTITLQLVDGTTTTIKTPTTLSSVLVKSKQYYTTDISIDGASDTAIVRATVSHGSTSPASQVVEYGIDNSASFPSISGENFIFEINPSNRNNSQSNKTKIVNEAVSPATELQATWSGMAWADGVDGWTVDNAGRKCLRLPANRLLTTQVGNV